MGFGLALEKDSSLIWEEGEQSLSSYKEGVGCGWDVIVM
jgi:hypothetical protein